MHNIDQVLTALEKTIYNIAEVYKFLNNVFGKINILSTKCDLGLCNETSHNNIHTYTYSHTYI